MTNIKKILSIVLALLMLISVFAVAPITASAEVSGDYEYEILDDGTIEITDYNGSDTDLEIPSKIKNKKVGEPDCLFRLTYPQRKFVSLLEGMRLQNKPIRVILLKARQWGGSTRVSRSGVSTSGRWC